MDHFEQQELRELISEVQELGVEVLSKTDSYMQDWYKVKVGNKEYSCGTNEYALKACLAGFLMGVEKQ